MKIVFKKQLEKIESAYRKTIYEVSSMVLVALAAVVGTLIVGGGNFSVYLTKIVASYGMMKVIYPLYENFHLRDLVQKIGELIWNKVGKDPEQLE